MSKLMGGLSGLIGIALIAFGFYAVYATTTVTTMTGLAPQGVAGMNEARSIYAGSFWAMGALILYALANARVRQPVLMAVGVIFGGFVSGRIVSIAMDGYDPLLTASIGSEVVAAIILLAASRHSATNGNDKG